jgi:DNA-binding GntR family transcriptional regulator
MPVPEQREPVERHLLRDTAYSALCDAIVAGTLAPGERIHDGELCSWLGLSRTPVREALARLQEDGLVEMAPQRYTRVAPMSPREARDCFPLVAALHALATELAVPHLGRVHVQRLRAENDTFLRALHAREGPAAYAADDRFHEVFLAVAGNPQISQVLRRLAPRVHRLERLRNGALPGRRSVAQHEAIIARAAAGDAAGAGSAARENWLELGSLVERSLTPAP